MSQTGPGWTCPMCGRYILAGNYHNCQQPLSNPSVHFYPPPLPDQTDRLISAIERLIAAIDKVGGLP